MSSIVNHDIDYIVVFKTFQGPCTGNQQSLAHSRLWDAVVGFLHVFAHMQMKLSQVCWSPIKLDKKLQSSMPRNDCVDDKCFIVILHQYGKIESLSDTITTINNIRNGTFWYL